MEFVNIIIKQVENWEYLEQIFNYSFENLSVKPKEHPILISEVTHNPREVREKTMKFLFEKFNIPAFYISKAPVLTMFSHGKSTGLVIESGSSGTSVIPITEGKNLIKKRICFNKL
jgi:actin-related protein